MRKIIKRKQKLSKRKKLKGGKISKRKKLKGGKISKRKGLKGGADFNVLGAVQPLPGTPTFAERMPDVTAVKKFKNMAKQKISNRAKQKLKNEAKEDKALMRDHFNTLRALSHNGVLQPKDANDEEVEFGEFGFGDDFEV